MNIMCSFVVILIPCTGKPLCVRKYLRIQRKEPQDFTVDSPGSSVNSEDSAAALAGAE